MENKMITNSAPTPNFQDNSLNFELSLIENEKNIHFSIEIKKISEDNLQIDINEKDAIKKYSKKLSLKELIQLDKNFKLYDSIEEMIFIKKVENKKGISISRNKNDLILTISLFNIDDSKINIIIIPNELTQSELMNYLYDKINEISFLKTKIKDLENKIIEISSKHEKDIENLKKLIENNQKEEKNEVIINKYIKGYSDLTFIENEIIKQLNKLIKSYNLVYKASKDGDKASDFHNKCDNVNNNLSIVKTKKGKIFGGFTKQNWKQIGVQDYHKYDENAFVFSVNNKKIYNIKDKSRAIYCRNDLALFFSSSSDIYIYNNCFNSQRGTFQSAYDYKGENYALNGESKFDLEDYEVYQVECK